MNYEQLYNVLLSGYVLTSNVSDKSISPITILNTTSYDALSVTLANIKIDDTDNYIRVTNSTLSNSIGLSNYLVISDLSNYLSVVDEEPDPETLRKNPLVLWLIKQQSTTTN